MGNKATQEKGTTAKPAGAKASAEKPAVAKAVEELSAVVDAVVSAEAKQAVAASKAKASIERTPEPHAVTGTKVEYPKFLYHPEHGATLVHCREEHDDLSDEYQETPHAQEDGE